jgi:hypothetical protein
MPTHAAIRTVRPYYHRHVSWLQHSATAFRAQRRSQIRNKKCHGIRPNACVVSSLLGSTRPASFVDEEPAHCVKPLCPTDEIRHLHQGFTTMDSDKPIIRKTRREGSLRRNKARNELLQGQPASEDALSDSVRNAMLQLSCEEPRIGVRNSGRWKERRR